MAGPKKSSAKRRDIEIDGDAVKHSQRLLDVVHETTNAATALREFRDKYVALLPKNGVNHLNLIISALGFIHDFGRTHTAKVSTVGYLLRAYDMCRRAKRLEALRPRNKQMSEATVNLKAFVKQCERSGKRDCDKASAITVTPPPPAKKQRRSDRHVKATPEQEEKEIANLLTGQPTFPDTTWTKETLINAMIKLEGTGMKKAFINQVLAVGKTQYATDSSIYRMYNRYKETKSIPSGRGRPVAMSITDAERQIQISLEMRSSSSSAFTLSIMKNSIASKQKIEAESNGLCPDSIECVVSDRTAKIIMTAAAMGVQGISFTKRSLQPKSVSRFIS